MRNLMYILIITLFAQCKQVSDNSVGYEKDGRFTLDYPQKDSIVTAWNKILSDNKLQSMVKDISIIEGTDYGNHKKFYALLGRTSADSAQVAQSLIKKGSKFYFDGETPQTLVCHGSNDCKPVKGYDQWGCDSGDDLKCHKIESINVSQDSP
ncbi:hypothetical protein HUK80_01955 [Flavobacterium sp. MAH-1]|uniref:Uncharacterized protein n=1 Tax=Flavobacterium agri TaxID=2743471 RepID=A0A7Y8XZ83_9FLAO|nr:hypothetical protein [Flavobacterium agri]NUY79644.1 hypothetical protein [Flavobacterium agri]NYA69669.1 hypothetical protein [Flavobacterium agri]